MLIKLIFGERVPLEHRDKIFACRNTFESISRPIGMLFGELIIEKYLTAFSENNNALMTAIFYNTTGFNIGFLSFIYYVLAFIKNFRSDYRALKEL